ncbi:hypothetical protein Ancab_013453 [Ancistrocladus abbreviatus]
MSSTSRKHQGYALHHLGRDQTLSFVSWKHHAGDEPFVIGSRNGQCSDLQKPRTVLDSLQLETKNCRATQKRRRQRRTYAKGEKRDSEEQERREKGKEDKKGELNNSRARKMEEVTPYKETEGKPEAQSRKLVVGGFLQGTEEVGKLKEAGFQFSLLYSMRCAGPVCINMSKECKFNNQRQYLEANNMLV